jgi:hypothetical protein
MTTKISFIQHKHNFADNIWGVGVPNRPWVLGVKLEREGFRFELALNIHTLFPQSHPRFVILYTFSTNGSREWQHVVYFLLPAIERIHQICEGLKT